LLHSEGRAGGLGALGRGALDEQRDAEGYLAHRVGEVLHGRYKVRRGGRQGPGREGTREGGRGGGEGG